MTDAGVAAEFVVTRDARNEEPLRPAREQSAQLTDWQTKLLSWGAVVGRRGWFGWAVVVDESSRRPMKLGETSGSASPIWVI